ncbi:MAG: hypothetical protein WEB58_18300 [Planctomycetaceae bacterium]
MQVHLCRHLFDAFESDDCRIFIEPCFRDAQGSRSPDMVICDSQNIIGIIELKYMPRKPPKYKKDLRTLNWFVESADTVVLSNHRYFGIDTFPMQNYKVADDAVLCWGGVYCGPRVKIEEHELARSLGSRFLCLHAVTSAEQAPEIFPASC